MLEIFKTRAWLTPRCLATIKLSTWPVYGNKELLTFTDYFVTNEACYKKLWLLKNIYL